MANMDFFKKFSNQSFEGKSKAKIDILVDTDKSYHFDEVYFRQGDNGEYAQFSLREDKEHFFNANSVVSNILIEIRDAGEIDNLPAIAWRFEKRTSQNWGTDYVTAVAVFAK